jgi:hypothetical protein
LSTKFLGERLSIKLEFDHDPAGWHDWQNVIQIAKDAPVEVIAIKDGISDIGSISIDSKPRLLRTFREDIGSTQENLNA